ncbi:hypothetical protein B0T17DRAFT_621501 [Bombardia bombarda]|uniref:Uncharacterized protein n=1 Tax=Bombardia bombarda TaxID=252184 RepID=A0AA39WA85_9PEZI|nr:hypothetical protein B0T17DRAFT_621501 [Bombardia bombarda]
MKISATLFFISLYDSVLGGGINWDVYEYGVVDSFRWSRPFPDDGTDPGGFHVNCRAETTFHARMHKLKDLAFKAPSGLRPWHDVIEDFMGHRDYPGTFDGVDHKGNEREIIVMEYTDVPTPVRDWIEEQQNDPSETNDKKWLFAVLRKPKDEEDKITETVKPRPTASPDGQPASVDSGSIIPDKDKIVVFAAGALYEILPLWVARGSRCERELNNLAKYRPSAVDHSVLAWIMDHTKPNREFGKRDMTFKVEAMAVTETEDGRKARLMWEKMHRAIKRNDRRIKKEERERAKKDMEEGRIKDEL